MKSIFPNAILNSILSALLFSFATPALAQEQAVKQALSGKRLLVTYREGGPLYGTFYFLDVHLCASGRYVTITQSRKNTVLDNTQINNSRDRGVWDVATFNGQVVLRSASESGGGTVLPIALQQNGGIWLGDGVTVIPQGAATYCN